MTLTVLIIILSVFAILGITEFVHNIGYFVLATFGKVKTAVVIFLREETALEQIRLARYEYNWFGSGYAEKIMAVYDNLSDETLNTLGEINDGSIVLVKTENICEVIDDIFG